MIRPLTRSFLAGLLATTFLLGIHTASAEDHHTQALNDSFGKKDLSVAETLLSQNPGVTDEVVRALLDAVRAGIAHDPEFSEKQISLAAEYAPKITPPTVPVVCADMRQIVQDFPVDQIGSPLYDAVIKAAQSFASAPVVVAAGQPNLCEDALLAQQPGMRPAGLLLRPVRPTPPVPPSAE